MPASPTPIPARSRRPDPFEEPVASYMTPRSPLTYYMPSSFQAPVHTPTMLAMRQPSFSAATYTRHRSWTVAQESGLRGTPLAPMQRGWSASQLMVLSQSQRDASPLLGTSASSSVSTTLDTLIPATPQREELHGWDYVDADGSWPAPLDTAHWLMIPSAPRR
ncbi:hypothetical protein MNAN1_001774 [Malassezia nana]|uniref:Uncharacterized protein n=1 Tax=Malassezia nana TaxID=180528 RepID=A0AAF0EHU8_9BASI|nr:hypothetical protein MNAN1_001774 [Malassezia nana]